MWGLSTIVIQIPPLGETHALPIRPMPPVCSSAMITMPCIFSTSPSAQSCFPAQMVDGVFSRYRIFLPINLVWSFLWISYGSSLLLMRVSRYPSFCDDEISYPIMRSSLICFQTAERVMPSSLLIVSPDTGPSDFSRIAMTRNAESGVKDHLRLLLSSCGRGQGSFPQT